MSGAQERWKGYRDKVYGGARISGAQEKECAQAFYAGMYAGFNDLLKISRDNSEDEAVRKVEDLRGELIRAVFEVE